MMWISSEIRANPVFVISLAILGNAVAFEKDGDFMDGVLKFYINMFW